MMMRGAPPKRVPPPPQQQQQQRPTSVQFDLPGATVRGSGRGGAMSDDSSAGELSGSFRGLSSLTVEPQPPRQRREPSLDAEWSAYERSADATPLSTTQLRPFSRQAPPPQREPPTREVSSKPLRVPGHRHPLAPKSSPPPRRRPPPGPGRAKQQRGDSNPPLLFVGPPPDDAEYSSKDGEGEDEEMLRERGAAYRAKFSSLKIDTTPPASPALATQANANVQLTATASKELLSSTASKLVLSSSSSSSSSLSSSSPKQERGEVRAAAPSPTRGPGRSGKSAPSPRVLAAASASAQRFSRALSPARRIGRGIARVFGSA